MEQFTKSNTVHLVGTAAGRPSLSHECRGEAFYLLPLTVRRLSGTEDTLPLLLRRRQLETLEIGGEEKLRVCGELRSFNNRSGEGARLRLTVFVRTAAFGGGEDDNLVLLRGALCREPRLRRTPLGREICDLLLAVRRGYGRSDYLPCLCWGAAAREAALWPVGTRVRLAGRFQSRSYIKQTPVGPEPRVAYEVSAAEIEREEE